MRPQVLDRQAFLLSPERYEVLCWSGRFGYLTYTMLNILTGRKRSTLGNCMAGLARASYVVEYPVVLRDEKIWMLPEARSASIFSQLALVSDVPLGSYDEHSCIVELTAHVHAVLVESEELVAAREIAARWCPGAGTPMPAGSGSRWWRRRLT